MRNLFLMVVTGVLLWACAGSPEREAAPIGMVATVAAGFTDAEIEQALALWQSYDMPEAPADSRVVTLFWPGSGIRINSAEPVPDRYFVAFAHEHEQEPNILFDGMRHFARSGTSARIEHRVPNPEEINFEPFHINQVFRLSLAVPMGLHLWRLGERALARRLLALALLNTRDYWIPHPVGRDLVDVTGTAIVAHWSNEALRMGSDRHIIHPRLERIVAELDVIRPGQDWDRDAMLDFVDRLGESMKPTTAAPGSPEYFIDALVDDGSFEFGLGDESSPSVELLHMGFDAVPALIAHLDDRRLSRIGPRGPRYAGRDVVTVGSRARVILKAMSNSQFRYRFDDGPIFFTVEYDVELVHEWWREARQEGEAAHFLRKLTESPNYRADRFVPARLLALRHPQVLAEAYPEMLREHTELGIFVATHAALAAGDYEPGQAAQLLSHGATEGQTTGVRLSALENLRHVDSDLFSRLVIEQVDKHDGQLGDDSEGMAGAKGLARLAFLDTRDSVWSALLNLTRRSEPRVRSGILYTVMHEAPGEARDVANTMVAQFMDDPDTWYMPEFVKSNTQPKGWDTTIGMGSTRGLAKYFGITTHRNSDEDWDRLRAQVREALANLD